MLYQSLIYLNAFAFIFYGISCLFSLKMKNEFNRFGIPHFRILTGILQLLGGLGNLVGIIWRLDILLISSVGLSLLMVSGFIVRLKIRDSFYASMPALILCALNFIIAYNTYIKL